MPITARYMAAQHVARRAGQLAHELFVNHKAFAAGDRSPDEHFDHGAHAISALIKSKLVAAFPADAFTDGDRPGVADADRQWMIEAIGGEHNFKRDIPFYAIAVAYAERGDCELAVVYDPERDEMFHALRDQGAWSEHGGRESRLEVSSCSELGRALISIALDDRVPDPAALPLRRELIDAGAAARMLGAPALELAHVAAGRLDGFVGLGLDPVSLRGALLLVEEAGGYRSQISTVAGNRSDSPIVGCAPNIARPLMAINEAWNAEAGVDLPVETPTPQGHRQRPRARRPAA